MSNAYFVAFQITTEKDREIMSDMIYGHVFAETEFAAMTTVRLEWAGYGFGEGYVLMFHACERLPSEIIDK